MLSNTYHILSRLLALQQAWKSTSFPSFLCDRCTKHDATLIVNFMAGVLKLQLLPFVTGFWRFYTRIHYCMSFSLPDFNGLMQSNEPSDPKTQISYDYGINVALPSNVGSLQEIPAWDIHSCWACQFQEKYHTRWESAMLKMGQGCIDEIKDARHGPRRKQAKGFGQFTNTVSSRGMPGQQTSGREEKNTACSWGSNCLVG